MADNYKERSFADYKKQHMKGMVYLKQMVGESDAYKMQIEESWIIDLYQRECKFKAFMRQQLKEFDKEGKNYFEHIACELYKAQQDRE